MKTNYWTLLMRIIAQCQRVTEHWKQVLDICMLLKWVESNSVGNHGYKWSKQNSVRPTCLITSICMITDPTGLHKVLLSINHDYNKLKFELIFTYLANVVVLLDSCFQRVSIQNENKLLNVIDADYRSMPASNRTLKAGTWHLHVAQMSGVQFSR